jgi:hypothetical protein
VRQTVSDAPKVGLLGWGFGGFLTFVLVLAALLMMFDERPGRPAPGSGVAASEDRPPWAGRTPSAGAIQSTEIAGCATGAPSEAAPADSELVPASEAELIGGGGVIDPAAAPPSRTGCVGLFGLDLESATALAVDRDGGVWIHWHELTPGFQVSTAVRTQDGQVDVIREIRDPGWLTTTPDGDVVLTVRGDEQVRVVARDPADDRTIELPGDAGSTSPEDNPLRGDVSALVIAADGGVLAARDEGIFALASDGARHIVGGFRAIDDAEIRVEGIEGQIESLVALPDDRAAFLTTQPNDDGRGPLYLLDSDAVRAVETPRSRDREIVRILPGPGGVLLAIAAGPDTHPQVLTIDVETGETDTVADLEGVMPHPDGAGGVPGALAPVSAAADGDDLILLADGLLWRLPDALG